METLSYSAVRASEQISVNSINDSTKTEPAFVVITINFTNESKQVAKVSQILVKGGQMLLVCQPQNLHETIFPIAEKIINKLPDTFYKKTGSVQEGQIAI